jgi:hypothetical protein
MHMGTRQARSLAKYIHCSPVLPLHALSQAIAARIDATAWWPADAARLCTCLQRQEPGDAPPAWLYCTSKHFRGLCCPASTTSTPTPTKVPFRSLSVRRSDRPRSAPEPPLPHPDMLCTIMDGVTGSLALSLAHRGPAAPAYSNGVEGTSLNSPPGLPSIKASPRLSL